MTPFAVIAFLDAFLLFQVQFVIGKFILPWFGGVPAVWTTSMMFFQVMLLLGYAGSRLASGPRTAHYVAALGFRFARENLGRIPTCCYGRQSGVGLSFRRRPNRACS